MIVFDVIVYISGGLGVADLGLDPAKLGDNHSRHLSLALCARDATDALYYVPTVVYDKKLGKCKDTTMPVLLPHEVLRAEIKKNKSVQA